MWPFVTLCLLSASRWLIEGAVPSTASTVSSEAVGCLFAGVTLSLWLGIKLARIRPLRGFGALCGAGLVGALVLAGPAMAALLAGRPLNPNNATLALALCPVVIAVVTVSGSGEHVELTALLWPGLAAVAGLLLLVPQPSFGSWRPWAGLLAMPLIVGTAAGWANVRLRASAGPALRQGLPVLAASLVFAAVLLGAIAAPHWRAGVPEGFSLVAAGLDGLTAVLSLVTLGRVGAVRWSAQFLLVPLLALLEGVLFLQPILDGRSYLAFALLAVSSAYQWMALPSGGGSKLIDLSESSVPGA